MIIVVLFGALDAALRVLLALLVTAVLARVRRTSNCWLLRHEVACFAAVDRPRLELSYVLRPAADGCRRVPCPLQRADPRPHRIGSALLLLLVGRTRPTGTVPRKGFQGHRGRSALNVA